jgi:serine/threonine protein kinase
MSQSNGSQTLVVAKHCPKELQPDSAGWSLNDFVIVKKLGVGGASAVYQALHRRSRACVALKLYFKSKLTALNTHQVQREVTIHSRLRHPSIISLVCPQNMLPC